MRLRFVLISILLCFLLLTVAFAQKPDFPVTLNHANEFIVKPNVDKVAALDLTVKLQSCIDTFPRSSLIPEALLAQSKLYTLAGKTTQATLAAQGVIDNFSLSESMPEAYKILWDLRTENGKNPLAGTEFTLNLAHKLGKSPTALDYYQKTFEIYRQANHWKEALAVGKEYLTTVSPDAPYPPMLLAYADVALRDGDISLAKENLESFIRNNPTLPHVVTARTILGRVQSALGNENLADENYSLAWTTYQKNRGKSEYNQHDVTHSAAEALWQMQVKSQRAFDEKTALGTSIKEKQIKRQVEELSEGYEQIMLTDPDFAARSLSSIGDTYSRFADLLLQDGYRTANAQGVSSKEPAYAAAMPEYTRAISAYSRACEQAHSHGDQHEADNAQSYAAIRVFELTSGQGDVLFAGAMDLQKHEKTIHKAPGANNLDFLTTDVLPVMNQALTYKQQALEFADRMKLASQATEARKSLDLAMKPAVNELLAICRDDWNTFKGNSTQLASAYARSSEPAMSKVITESVVSDQKTAKYDADKTFAAINDLFSTLQKCKPDKDTRDYWNDLIFSAYNDYASICRTADTYLQVCQTSLAKSSSEEAQATRTKFSKLQGNCSTEEYASLAKAYEIAAQFNIAGTTCDRFLARLAEIDPKRYGNLLEINSASRKHP